MSGDRVPYGFEQVWSGGTPPAECAWCGAAFGEPHNAQPLLFNGETFYKLCDEEECPECLWRRAYCGCDAAIHKEPKP
jgi:hypothetical protein